MHNARTIILTVGINIAASIYLWRKFTVITTFIIVTDAFFCGIITAVIDMLVIWTIMAKRAKLGQLPEAVPGNSFMQFLPLRKIPFTISLAIGAALLTAIFGVLFLKCFGVAGLNADKWLILKALYSCMLSAKIIEFITYRLLQPDWIEKTPPKM